MNNDKKKIDEKTERLVASVWPGIRLEKRLGTGAYGAVYECVRTDAVAGLTTREALKIIDMSFEDVQSMADEMGTTPESYYEDQKKRAIDEIRIMDQLKSPHIVHINDFHVVEKGDFEGFYILIRMDLLTSLANVMKNHVNDTQAKAEELAKKVALDICEALILCQKQNVIHRDIKPQNVFMSDNGEFYLGDFGVAKSLSELMSTLSCKGTAQYIAPEVGLGNYDHRADLYSLGLLLYQLLNHRRMPFCPPHPNTQTFDDGENASNRRFAGEPVPAPDNCSPAFAKIVLKLCQHNPDNRYNSAKELKDAILALNHTGKNQERAKPASGNQTVSQEFGPSKPFTKNNSAPEKAIPVVPKPDKKKMPVWAVAAVLTVVVIAGAMFFGKTVFAPKDNGDASMSYSDESGESPASGSLSESVVSAPSDKGVKLTSLNFVENANAEIKENVLNSLGDSFEEGVCLLGWSDSPYVRFYVGDYERLTGNFSCPDELVDSESKFRLSIYLDDAEDSPVQTVDMSRTIAVTPLDIDVSGADFITFQLENTTGDTTGLLLTDCLLYSDGSRAGASPASNAGQGKSSSGTADNVKLTSLNFVANLNAEVKKNVLNSLGDSFDEGVCLLGWSDSPYVRFYVGDYERLTGNFSCPDELVDSESKFRLSIYLDDAEDSPVQTVDMSRTIAVTPLDIDVSGADFITFQLENTTGDTTGLLLTDCYLTK